MLGKLVRSAIACTGIVVVCVLYAGAMYGLTKMGFGTPPEVSWRLTDVLRLTAFIGFLLVIDTGLIPALFLHQMKVSSLTVYLLNGGLAAVMTSYCFLLNVAVCCWSEGAQWVFSVPPFSWTKTGILELLQPSFFEKEAVLALLIGLACGAAFWRFVVQRTIKRESSA